MRGKRETWWQHSSRVFATALAANEFIQGNDDRAILAIIAGGRANTQLAMEGRADKLTEEEMLLTIE